MMKTTILLFIAIIPGILYGQTSSRATLAREVDRHVAAATKAADTFLNKRLAPAERLRAIEPYLVIYDEKQLAEFKGVVANAEETPEIRAAALRRVVTHVATDQRLNQLVFQWLGDPAAPKALREEALSTEGALSFQHMNLPEVYQKMLDAPELTYRVFAFTKLVTHGDQRAQQLLIRGLENPAEARLPAPTAIGILSMAAKKEFQPAVFKVLQQTKDPETRLEAIGALGGYPEAKQTLIAISRDPNERPEFREAALGALYAGDRDNVVQYVQPILTDDSAPSRLKGIGIQMSINVRQAMSYRTRAKKADDYDRLIQTIARETKDPDLRQIANLYLEAVKPRF
jgi:HEAT repeat protein